MGAALVGEGSPRAADAPFLPGPDRVPRTKVYEAPWGELELDLLDLPAGRVRLELSVPTPAGGIGPDVKSVRLTPG